MLPANWTGTSTSAAVFTSNVRSEAQLVISCFSAQISYNFALLRWHHQQQHCPPTRSFHRLPAAWQKRAVPMYQKSSQTLSRRIFVSVLERERNKRVPSKEATFLIYSDEWCEQRGFDVEVPVCSSLFRRDSSLICTSADLFFFLHKPNNLFLRKAVHPFEIFRSSEAPDVTLFYGAAATSALAAILMNLCHSHQQLWNSTEGGGRALVLHVKVS